VTRLGVVIPTHNRAVLLRRAVQSVMGKAKVVVVDDASSDETPEVGRELAAEGVHYRRLPTSRGPGFARNVGVQGLDTDLVLFLDDDDYVLPGGIEAILAEADRFPDQTLFLHNCLYPSGRPSIPAGKMGVRVTFEEWLSRYTGCELKPVARTHIFETHAFDDVRGSSEILLWAPVVREHGAVVSPHPVVYYDVSGSMRLTAPRVLLARAPVNAYVAGRLLDDFGEDFLRAAPERWRATAEAAVVYARLAGRTTEARARYAAVRHRLDLRDRLALSAVLKSPHRLVRVAFLVHRFIRDRWRAARR
jgi:glycosyltransferase involved in cell wall biosynthesis